MPFLLGVSMVSAVDLTPNVNAHYTLNETSGTAVSDSSGNGINGITVGNPLWVSGKLNNSLLFNGANQYVDLGNNFGFEYNKTFSVEAWVNLTATSSRAIISKVDRSTNYGWYLSVVDQKIYMTFSSSSSYALQSHVNDVISLNNWYHVIMVYNGTNKANGIKIYVNGTNQFLVNDYENLGNRSISNSRSAMIGVLDGSSSKSSYFTGRIDEAVIYNNTLTPEEVTFRWNNSYGTELMSGELPPPPTTTTTTTTTTVPTTTTTSIGNISTQYCYDNSTLYKRIAKYQGGVLNVTEEYINCDYGCSDNSCEPSDFMIAIGIIGVFIGLIILILIIMRLIK